MTDPVPTIHPRRRKLQFGLRSLFVLVAVLAIPLGWIAWQQRIVRERREILLTLNATVRRRGDPLEIDPSFFYRFAGRSQRGATQKPAAPEPSRLPFWRNWLGDDDTISSINLPSKTTDADFERVKMLYPEVIDCIRLLPPFPGTDGPPVKFLPEEDLYERWRKPNAEPFKSRILKEP